MAHPTSTPAVTRRRLRRPMAAGVVALAVALTAACGSEPPTEAPTAPPDVTVSPTLEPSRTTPPEPEVPIVWPLTGVETEEVAARPAVAVKVENTSVARPQSGLEAADVVWETIVEFEVSRFIAVYHSQVPAEVGPIRSVRPVDILVTEPLGGLLAFSGGQAGLLRDVNLTTIQSISHDSGSSGMYRIRSRSAPHNVYGSVEAFMAKADGSRAVPPPEQFQFAPRADQATAVVSGAPATTMALRMSAQARPSWTWDSSSATWLRSEGTSPATSASGGRLTATNVVAVTAAHVSSAYRAQGGTRVPGYALIGEGPALVATGGKVLEGTWSKASNDAPLQLFTADGAPLLLAPGNTWVELVPEGKGSVSTG